MNAESLLERVKAGKRLTDGELHFVRNGLRGGSSREDPYTLIHVLWKAHDTPSTNLIRTRTTDPDEMVRRIALQALTALSPSEAVFELALRMVQDPSRYVRMVAATAIGALGAQLPSRTAAAARFLLENFERRQSEVDSEWESYYEGLLDLTRVPQNHRPLATRALRISDVQPDVIATARSLASQT